MATIERNSNLTGGNHDIRSNVQKKKKNKIKRQRRFRSPSINFSRANNDRERLRATRTEWETPRSSAFTPFGPAAPPPRLFQYRGIYRSAIVAGTTELDLETGNQAWIRVTDVTTRSLSVSGRSQGSVLDTSWRVKVVADLSCNNFIRDSLTRPLRRCVHSDRERSTQTAGQPGEI